MQIILYSLGNAQDSFRNDKVNGKRKMVKNACTHVFKRA